MVEAYPKGPYPYLHTVECIHPIHIDESGAEWIKVDHDQRKFLAHKPDGSLLACESYKEAAGWLGITP